MVWDVLGVNTWTLAQVMELTFPQLIFIQRGRGRILYARLEPQVQANLANLSAKPGPKGEPSEAHKVIQQHQKRKAGVIVPPTAEERTLAYARRILLEPYLGDPDAVEQRTTTGVLPTPFPGMGIDEAQAWVAWVQGHHCPAPVWLEIQDVYNHIFAAAQVKGG